MHVSVYTNCAQLLPVQTYLASFCIDVALTEEFLDHSHVLLLLLYSRQRCQHDGCVASLVWLVHATYTCGREFEGRKHQDGDVLAMVHSLHSS